MVNRVSADRQTEEGDPAAMFLEFPEKKLLLPNAKAAGSEFFTSSPIPYNASPVACERPKEKYIAVIKKYFNG